MKKNKVFSYAYVIIAYMIAIYVGKLSLEYVQTTSHLLDMLIADIIATVVIFIFSLGVQNSSVYDPYWSLIPVPIAFYWIYLFPEGNQTRQVFMVVVIAIWSARLTINWIRSCPDLAGWSIFWGFICSQPLSCLSDFYLYMLRPRYQIQ